MRQKTTFSRFARLLREGTETHIPHIEDLDVKFLIRSLDKIQELEAVQKLDGAHLVTGIDKKGEFYTSRELKSGKRFYSLKDYPDTHFYDGFRAAHEVLDRQKDGLGTVLVPGEALSLEIIYGAQPNTVLYGKDNMNYIVPLETLPGDDPNITPDQNKPKEVVKLLGKKVHNVSTPMYDTADGQTMAKADRPSTWKFVSPDKIPEHLVSKLDFNEELVELRKWLKQENEAAKKIGRDLSNEEVLSTKDTTKLNDERSKLKEKILNDFKLPIKKKLLKIIDKLQPSLRGPTDSVEAYQGIEGIIFTHPESRERFKVVDKDTFSKVNKFNYQVRRAISSRVSSSDPDLPIETRGGILGQARIRALTLLGLPSLEVSSQTKKILGKFKGNSRAETLKNIVRSLTQLNPQAARRKIQAIYSSALDDLDDDLESFKQNVSTFSVDLPDGKKVKYTGEIKRRTLLAFAEARREIFSILKKLRGAHTTEELLEVLVGRVLDRVHADDEMPEAGEEKKVEKKAAPKEEEPEEELEPKKTPKKEPKKLKEPKDDDDQDAPRE